MLDIRYALHKKGMTQKELAEKMGKTDMTIWYMLKKNDTRISVLYQIADILGVSIIELFSEYHEQEQKKSVTE